MSPMTGPTFGAACWRGQNRFRLTNGIGCAGWSIGFGGHESNGTVSRAVGAAVSNNATLITASVATWKAVAPVASVGMVGGDDRHSANRSRSRPAVRTGASDPRDYPRDTCSFLVSTKTRAQISAGLLFCERPKMRPLKFPT